MTFADAAVQLAESGLYVFPLIPGEKRPAVKDWENKASCDPLEVSKMWASRRQANIGIATGPSQLVVIDLDGDEAIAWWEANGVPGGARVDTPSGGRHHFWWCGPEIEIQTNRSKIFRGIDVRASGGLVVAPGSITAKGAYTGDLSTIPEAPEALLDMLPRRQHFAEVDLAELDGVEPVEAATEQEERELAWIADELDALERPWRDGAGWRGTVFQMSCYLSRMVNAPWYALDEPNARALLLQHAPSDHTWGQQQIIAEWNDARKRTAGQVADRPTEPHPPLLLWTGFPEDREFPTLGGEMFVAVWRHRPEKESSGALWAHRQKLLRALLRSGFTDQEAATVVWHSAAAALPAISFGGQLIPDGDSKCILIEDLWKEVAQAKAEETRDSGATIEAAPIEERPDIDPAARTYSFLTDDERKYIAGSAGDWFGRSFVNWARDTFGKINEAYYAQGRWVILSIIFGTKAVLPFKMGIDRRVTLYVMELGPTTSGKSTALAALGNTIGAFYLDPDNPDVGGDFTPEALAETLINRDGLSTFFNVDEAHTVISEKWKKVGSPYSHMPGVLTDLYDGRQKAIHRATKRDISGKSAEVFLTVLLMGTFEGMVDVIEPSDWTSGLMPRFVWGIGVPMERTKEMIASGWITEDQLDGRDDDEKLDAARRTYRQWAAEFASACQRISRPDGRPSVMQLPTEVMARWSDFAWNLHEIAQSNRRHAERLEATFSRLSESTLRAAALVALSRGRRRLEMSDLLIAIEQAEEWAANARVMVIATEETIRDRKVNAIERFVHSRGGVAPLRDVNLEFRNQRRVVEDLIGELIAQGRMERQTDRNTGVELVRVKGIGIEKEAA